MLATYGFIFYCDIDIISIILNKSTVFYKIFTYNIEKSPIKNHILFIVILYSVIGVVY